MMNVLGESGELTILNSANNEVIAKVNAGSAVDENGNVTVYYGEGISEIKIKTTWPKKSL